MVAVGSMVVDLLDILDLPDMPGLLDKTGLRVAADLVPVLEALRPLDLRVGVGLLVLDLRMREPMRDVVWRRLGRSFITGGRGIGDGMGVAIGRRTDMDMAWGTGMAGRWCRAGWTRVIRDMDTDMDMGMVRRTIRVMGMGAMGRMRMTLV